MQIHQHQKLRQFQPWDPNQALFRFDNFLSQGFLQDLAKGRTTETFEKKTGTALVQVWKLSQNSKWVKVRVSSPFTLGHPRNISNGKNMQWMFAFQPFSPRKAFKPRELLQQQLLGIVVSKAQFAEKHPWIVAYIIHWLFAVWCSINFAETQSKNWYCFTFAWPQCSKLQLAKQK